MKQRVISSLHWKCCPGYTGKNCEYHGKKSLGWESSVKSWRVPSQFVQGWLSSLCKCTQELFWTLDSTWEGLQCRIYIYWCMPPLPIGGQGGPGNSNVFTTLLPNGDSRWLTFFSSIFFLAKVNQKMFFQVGTFSHFKNYPSAWKEKPGIWKKCIAESSHVPWGFWGFTLSSGDGPKYSNSPAMKAVLEARRGPLVTSLQGREKNKWWQTES